MHLLAAGVQDWFSELSAATDSKGQFSLKGVPSGSYYISAGTYERGKTHNTRRQIEVGESNVDSIVLSLSGGATTIHGRVIGGNSRASGSAAVVREPIAEEAESEPGYTEVEKEGSFELQGVLDGSYALEVYLQEQGWFVKSAHLGNEEVTARIPSPGEGGPAIKSDPVPVTLGEPLREREFSRNVANTQSLNLFPIDFRITQWAAVCAHRRLPNTAKLEGHTAVHNLRQ